MKTLLILLPILVLGLFSVQAFAQNINLSGANLNHPGIKWDWKIQAENYTFIVDTVSNYDMQNVVFDKDTKTLTLLGNSSHTGNIAEIQIPINLIGGNYTVSHNGNQISPLILQNGNTTLVVLKFNDTGATSTNITGTTYLPEFSGIVPAIMASSFAILFFTLKTKKI